jgi:hypothetical protein
MEEVWTALVDGAPHEASDQEVLALYETQGYNPSDPSSDQGATLVGVLTSWRKAGLGSDKVLGWAEVDIANRGELLSACWLFGGLYMGFNVPQSALDQFYAGKIWDVVPDDGGLVGGHCVNAVGYDAQGMTIITWGRPQKLSWAFYQKYFDEVCVAIPQDYDRLGNRLLEGFSEKQLEQDIDSIGGNVPPPGPQPSPPGPGPSPTPTPHPGWSWLENLIHWLEQHF